MIRDVHMLQLRLAPVSPCLPALLLGAPTSALSSMRDSSVLLIGVRGLSCEVAKNIVLAGIGSLVLLDDSNVTPRDLAANFLVTAEDVGKNVSREKTRTRDPEQAINERN